MPDRVKEKLVELLKNVFYRFIDDPYCIPDEEKFAEDLVANGVTVQDDEDNNVPSKWIPASEPPKEPGEYNVAQKHWLDGHLESKRGKWNGVEWFVDGKESLMVTHWMPLPQPPEGE